MPRVVGTDPGSSSLDLLLLDDGKVADQSRLGPDAPAESLLAILHSWQPLDLIAGPSGYGLPLVKAADVTEADIDLMSLVHPDERGNDVGVGGFRRWLRALVGSRLPVVFLPGGIHLPTIPEYRKANTIDMGTSDKVALAALAIAADERKAPFAVVEVGSVFTAVLVVDGGEIVDVSAGTRGPLGLQSSGGWDGEVAYMHGRLRKNDLFRGGMDDLGDRGPAAFRESLRRHVAGLRSITPFDCVYLEGSGLTRPEIARLLELALSDLVEILPLPTIPGAWVKHAAQGSALIADGLAGGSYMSLVAYLRLREASGTALDHLSLPSR